MITDQAEVEPPEAGHDHHVGRPRDGDQEGEEAPGDGEAVQEAVQVLVVRVGQPEQGGHMHHPTPGVLESLTN